MKKKALQQKETGELKKMLQEAKAELPKTLAEHKVRKSTNIKKAFELKRRIATLSGLISGRSE